MDNNLNLYKAKLPYPPIVVAKPNKHYAEIIQVNFAGAVSEFSAISQYINHHFRTENQYTEISKTLEHIAIVEMYHLEILGKLIIKLGGNPGYWINKKDKKLNWSPHFINYGLNVTEMINYDINDEKVAIKQYISTQKKIDDSNIISIIDRIILDEEVHIQILTELSKKYLTP